VLESRSHTGPSIDPELLLCNLPIGYLYCIASEHREATGSSAVFAMLGGCQAA
jgi:hypothetical protein